MTGGFEQVLTQMAESKSKLLAKTGKVKRQSEPWALLKKAKFAPSSHRPEIIESTCLGYRDGKPATGIVVEWLLSLHAVACSKCVGGARRIGLVMNGE